MSTYFINLITRSTSSYLSRQTTEICMILFRILLYLISFCCFFSRIQGLTAVSKQWTTLELHLLVWLFFLDIISYSFNHALKSNFLFTFSSFFLYKCFITFDTCSHKKMVKFNSDWFVGKRYLYLVYVTNDIAFCWRKSCDYKFRLGNGRFPVINVVVFHFFYGQKISLQ